MSLRPLWLACLAIGLVLAAQRAELESPPALADIAISTVRDLEASVSVTHADLPALEKINKDFGIAYRLREVTIRYKEPDKFRMESRIGVMIVNGPTRIIRVPQLGIRKRDEVGEALSRRHSLLDLGLVATGAVARLDATYLRSETLGEVRAHIFEVRPKPSPADGATAPPAAASGDRYLLWVDPVRKIVLRRRWVDDDGSVRATFDYLEPREVGPGTWMPTKIEVRNGAGVLAGATTYRDIKINRSPSDTLFAIEGASGQRSADDGR